MHLHVIHEEIIHKNKSKQGFYFKITNSDITFQHNVMLALEFNFLITLEFREYHEILSFEIFLNSCIYGHA